MSKIHCQKQYFLSCLRRVSSCFVCVNGVDITETEEEKKTHTASDRLTKIIESKISKEREHCKLNVP